MKRLSDFSLHSLGQMLDQGGLYLQTGPFTTHLRSSLPSVAEGLHLLYGQYPVSESAAFADFHVSVERPANIRRWLRPQALFLHDGASPFKPLPVEQAFPLFEWGLNWCVSSQIHTHLIVHAAVIERAGRAIMMPAPAGSGKSTLCAALSLRGWRLLTDELAMISVRDGLIAAMPRPVSLKNQSIDVIRSFEPSAILSPAVHDTTKGTVAHLRPESEHVERAAESARLAAVVFPKYQSGADLNLQRVSRPRALIRVAENAFNYSLLGQVGFETLSAAMEPTVNFDFSYSRLDEALRAFDTLLERDL